MMQVYVGIDVAKAMVDVGVVSAANRDYARFANSSAGFAKLDRFLRRHQARQGWGCLEATGQYSEALADWLHAVGYRVSVVNPAAVRSYAHSRLSRNKTDKVDAYLFGRVLSRPPTAAVDATPGGVA